MPNYDILIKSGRIWDGGADENYQSADIAVQGEKIAEIGNLKDATAPLIIDASEKYVTPGFIDITNHSDTHLTIFKYPGLESLILQGVTTIIGGNCGASLAPLGNPDAINAIRKWADPSGTSVNWATMKDYLERAENLQPSINYGTFVGYGTLRRGVIGDDTKLLSQNERERMKFLLKNAVSEGAFGLSLGLSYGHERISTTEEVIDVASVLSETGGIIKLHLRSEGKELIAGVNEAVRLARETGVAVQISHFKSIGKKARPQFKRALELIDRAESSGVPITFDVSPYATTGSLLYLLIPAWARRGGFPDLFRRLDDPAERTRIIAEINAYTLHYDRILITSAKMTNLIGKTLAEIAEHALLKPEEVLLDVVRANEGQVSIIGRTVSQENMRTAVKHTNSIIGSDGEGYSIDESSSGNIVHPRSFGAFAHFWHSFVSEHHVLKPQEAILKMSSGPASVAGIKDRGRLKKGNFADIAIFDPAQFRDSATYKNPYRYAVGMEWVMVNGKVAVEKGKYLGVRAGKIIRRL
ncbi:MAG: N-acyl-D-amino-acid deacylase [Parcubacteria group bacterium GW2011_GWA2_45_30]|nr:MAG: N-acyl-D-amino-acid deacylase [Parcubacteria group bacterium GW2011_GWA2_45_30]